MFMQRKRVFKWLLISDVLINGCCFFKAAPEYVSSQCPTEGWNILQGSIYDVKADKCMQKMKLRLINVKQKHNLSIFLHELKATVHAKNVNPLPIILLFQVEKCILSESGEKYAQIKHYLQAKTVQNCDSDFDVRGQQAWTLSLDDALLWVILRGRWMLEYDWLSVLRCAIIFKETHGERSTRQLSRLHYSSVSLRKIISNGYFKGLSTEK